MTFIDIRRVLISLAVGIVGIPSALASNTCDRDEGVVWGSLQATLRYHPIGWQDDAQTLGPPKWFFVPLAAHVTSGQSGPDLASLSWRDTQGGIGVCLYQGTGAHLRTTTCTGNGDEYRLTLCTLVDSSGITFFGNDGLIQAATSIRFHFWGGDPCATTTAALELTCPPDQDGDGTPDCVEPPHDISAPTWPSGSALVAGVSGQFVTLGWTAAADNVAVTAYHVYVDGQVVQQLDGSSLSTQVGDISPGVPHTFQVQALDAAGNESVGGPTAQVMIDVDAPRWPIGSTLVPSLVGDRGTFTWSAATDNVAIAGYRLFEDGQRVAETNAETLSAEVTGLTPNTSHAFQVQAFDRAGNASTDGPMATVRIDTLAPTWPAGAVLTATRGPTAVTLGWPAASDEVAVSGYRIFQNGLPIAEVDGTTFHATVTLDPMTAYTFRVEAFDAAGNTSTDGPTVMLAPSGGAPTWPDGALLSATPVGLDGVVVLDWDSAEDDVGVTDYIIYEDGLQLTQVPAMVTFQEVTGVSLGAHHFEIVALDADGNRSPSLQADTELEINSPTWPAGSAVTASPTGLLNVVSLAWTPADDDVGVTSYFIVANGNVVAQSTEPTALVVVFNASVVTFEIEALDANGNFSVHGPTVRVTIDLVAPVWPPGTQLLASSSAPGTTTLRWTPATDANAILYYMVYQDGVQIARVAGATLALDLAGLSSSRTYTFQIKAQDAWGNLSTGDPTLVLRADTNPPTWLPGSTLTATQVGSDAAMLLWTPAVDDVAVTSYRILQDGVPVRDVTGNVLFAQIVGLVTQTSYLFQVQALDARSNVSNGPVRALAFDRGAPTWPPGSTLTASLTDTTATLSWTEAVDDVSVDRYIIYLDGTPVRTVLAPTRSTEVFDLEADADQTFEVEAFDRAGNRSINGPFAGLHTGPPPPPLVAPPLDQTVATTLYQSTAFLYTGDNPVQRGVAPGTIVRERSALVRGRVLTRDGHPLAGVTISILNHPEYGTTATRSDGELSMAVNGGAPLFLVYSKARHIVAQRRVAPQWKESVQAPDVVLVALDPAITRVARLRLRSYADPWRKTPTEPGRPRSSFHRKCRPR